MKYFIDTEFQEDFNKPLFGKRRHFIDLISIGIVSEDNREYYAISKDFDLKSVWNKWEPKRVDVSGDGKNIYPEGFYINKDYWLRDSVLKPIFDEWKMNINGKIVRLGLPIALNEDRFTYKNFKKVIKYIGKSNKQIAEEVRAFVNPCSGEGTLNYKSWNDHLNKFNVVAAENRPIEFYGYYSNYDWVLLCSLFGRMIDLPKGFPMYCKDLKQILDEKTIVRNGLNYYMVGGTKSRLSFCEDIKKHSNYPKQENEHNALADAKWNKKLYEFLNKM